jgi:uncharacterized UBP type Zn finger protein
MSTMEDHIQSLISMGFINRDLNRKALIKSNNDISEAVTILTSYNYFNDEDFLSTETTTSTMFIGPLTKEQVEQQQQQQTVRRKKKRKNDKEKEKIRKEKKRKI